MTIVTTRPAIDGNIIGSDAHAAIIGALDGGRSATIGLLGDSTGFAPTNTSATLQWFYQLGAAIGALNSNWRVEYKSWNSTIQDMQPWAIVQAGASGERYARFPGPSNGRSLRFSASDFAAPTSDYDISLKLSGDSLSAAALQTILAHQGGTNFRGFTWTFQTNGDLKLTWFPNSNSETNLTLTATAANLGLTNGVVTWLRFTLVAATGVVTIYTGTDENTWTSVATTTVGATSIGDPGSSVFWEIGGRSGSLEAFTGNIYKVEIRNGIRGPVLNPEPIDAWQTPFVGSFGGSPTLFCFNGSEPGQGIDWFNGNLGNGNPRLPMMVRNIYPAIQYISTGKNDTLYRGKALWTVMSTLLTSIKARAPGAAISIVSQNPTASPATAPDQSNGRTREMLQFALTNGLLIGPDTFRAFSRDPRGIAAGGALTQSDGVHPNDPAGSLLWMQTALAPYTARSHR